MISFLVCSLFAVYVLIVVFAGHVWRRIGLQFLEYVAGALIVVLCARLQLDLTPGADWFDVIVRHYTIALLFVAPMEAYLILRQRAAAARQEAADGR